jgi:hypothetical protein
MAATQVLSILQVRCVDCGDAGRLVTVTTDSVISRCYVCGDTEVRARDAGVAAGGGVTGPVPVDRRQPAAA